MLKYFIKTVTSSNWSWALQAQFFYTHAQTI